MATPLDAVDVRILQLLQHDARLTNKEIADKLSKSVTAVYDRIRRLETEGYIKGYVALLDKEMIGKNLIGYITVRLKEHSQAGLRNFQKEVAKFPEAMECYQMAGESDFLIKVAIGDMIEYNEFLMNKLSTLPNIGVVQTSFVLSEAKRETAYPLSLPAPARKTRG